MILCILRGIVFSQPSVNKGHSLTLLLHCPCLCCRLLLW